MRNQDTRFQEGERVISEYVQIRSNGQITLPAPTCRKAKLKEEDSLEVLGEEGASNRLIPYVPVDRALAEKHKLADVD